MFQNNDQSDLSPSRHSGRLTAGVSFDRLEDAGRPAKLQRQPLVKINFRALTTRRGCGPLFGPLLQPIWPNPRSPLWRMRR